jgi:hypothetical protein
MSDRFDFGAIPYRMKDLVDVQELIGALDLPLALADQLDESVRAQDVGLSGIKDAAILE